MRTQRGGWYGTLVAVLVLAVGLLLSACATSPDVGQAQPGGVGAAAGASPPGAGPGAAAEPPRVSEAPVRPPGVVAERPVTPVRPAAPGPATPAGGPLEDVFFDFDKAVLRDDAKASLNRDISWLKSNGGVKVVIEGHADERGTNEYNLALGDRRSKTVQDYLVAAGIAAGRIRMISYGEERPFVLGHDESAWRWNRRGHFIVQP